MVSMPKKLLLMGSSAYREELPPKEFQKIIEEAVARADAASIYG
jgi:glycine/serine hydroxymethyltransferase